jgi:hypothetical protein
LRRKRVRWDRDALLYPSFHFSFISNLYLIGLQVVQDPVKVRRIALPAAALAHSILGGPKVEGGNEMKGTNE